jgi:hypothetical protein
MALHDASGRKQEMFCLALRTVPMWLATLTASRVRPEAQEKLIRYQCEAVDVLARAFMASPLEHQGQRVIPLGLGWTRPHL